MTTMISWVGLNEGRANAVYLASDSRITWQASQRWDAGRKLFSCARSPDMFGYSGDVLFPLLVLGQVVELADRGLIFPSNMKANRRHAAVFDALQASCTRRHNVPDAAFEILHVARQGEGATASFTAWVTRYGGRGGRWIDEQVELDAEHPLIFGSGAEGLAEALGKRRAPNSADQNALIFSTFCDGLERKRDSRSGGVPQLVGLFRQRPAQAFGIVHEGKRFFHGLPAGTIQASRIPWRDRNFVAMDGGTLAPMKFVRRRDRARTRQTIRSTIP